ncbi:hypothetical protein FQY83_00070 [Luteimonas marina]|uniref:Outer membrane beta-barrel protein n=1 Tax=Luteimonas marina TaxID=488485 RepID=A0A5C5UAU9_9GAMM|nr:hypothetical protein [Luteimonas marina]TWT23088.1 hypothetical protein FQY83_00070 [Luteimonas marina]
MKLHRTSVPAACLAVLATVPLQAHAVRIDYAVDMGIEFNDNVLMSSSDAMDSDALRAGFGFVLTEETSTVQANFGGRFEYWNYISGPQSNAFETSLAGRLNWFIMPETLSFTVEDSLEMRPIDRFAPDAPNNRQRVNVLSLGPNLLFNWGAAFRGRAEARWIDTSAEENDEFESSRLSAAVHLIRDLDPTSSLTFSLRGQDVDFDHDLMARDYRRYDGYVRYQKELSRLGFAFDAGYTWVDYADGSSESLPIFRGQATWELSNRSSLSLGGARQLSDAGTAAIEEIGTVVVVPDSLTGYAAGVESSVYRERRADINYTYAGERILFSAGPYYERIEYIDTDAFDETRRGAIVQIAYRLAPTWDLETFVDAARAEFPQIGREMDDLRLGVDLSKTWNRRWSSSLRYTHYRREDDGVLGNASQNIWYLTVVYRNR